MIKLTTPQPKGLPCGIYFGLSEERYRRDPALNYSGLKDLQEGPEFFWAKSPMNPDWKPKKPTEDQMIGTITHCLLLEPDEFHKRYYVNPGGEYSPEKRPVNRYQWTKMCEAVEIVRNLPDLEMLLQRGYAEVAIIWEDPKTGVRMKAKHDWWKAICSVDYKKRFSITPKFIRSAFYNYGYHIQACHYIESRKQLRQALINKTADVYCDRVKVDMREIDRFISGEDGTVMDNFVFIFQMPEAPYSARVFELSDFTLNRGERDSADLIASYVENMNRYGTDRWMGNYGQIEEFDMDYGFQDRV